MHRSQQLPSRVGIKGKSEGLIDPILQSSKYSSQSDTNKQNKQQSSPHDQPIQGQLLNQLFASPQVQVYGQKIQEQEESTMTSQCMSQSQLTISRRNHEPLCTTQDNVLNQSIVESVQTDMNTQENREVYVPFKEKYTHSKRERWQAEASLRYPSKVAIIMETASIQEITTYWQYFWSFIHKLPLEDVKQLNNPKFLVPNQFQVRDLVVVLKNKLGIEKNDTIIIFANNTVLKPSNDILSIYQKYKDTDGFLYLKYIKEDTFG